MKEAGRATARCAAQWAASGHGVLAPWTVEPPHSLIYAILRGVSVPS